MSNLTIFPSSGGIVVSLKRSGTVTKGANVRVTADSTVAVTGANAIVQDIALDAGAEGIDADVISVLLLAHTVITVSDIGSTAVGHYLKPDADGTFCDDGTTKTVNSVAFVVNVTTKQIAIL
jgi:hypothetical protein